MDKETSILFWEIMEVYHCRLTVCGLFFRDFQQRLMYDEVKTLEQILLLWWVMHKYHFDQVIFMVRLEAIHRSMMNYSSHGGKWSVYDRIWVLYHNWYTLSASGPFKVSHVTVKTMCCCTWLLIGSSCTCSVPTWLTISGPLTVSACQLRSIDNPALYDVMIVHKEKQSGSLLQQL